MGYKFLYTYATDTIDIALQTKKLSNPVISNSGYCTAPSTRTEYINNGLLYHYSFTQTYNVRTSVTKTSYGFTNINLSNTFKNFMNLSPYRSVWVDSNCDGVKNSLATNAELTIGTNIVLQEQKTLLFGFMGDNKFKLYIDGVLIVQVLNVDVYNFIYLNLFPVTLSPGQHLITFTGIGDGSVNDSLGVIVYDNTIEELVTPVPKSEWNVIYSSEYSLTGQTNIVTCAVGSYDSTLNKCVYITSINNINSGDTCLITPLINNIPSYKIVSWTLSYGDNTPNSFGIGLPPIEFEHVYTNIGTYNILFTLLFNVGGVQSRKSITVT